MQLQVIRPEHLRSACESQEDACGGAINNQYLGTQLFPPHLHLTSVDFRLSEISSLHSTIAGMAGKKGENTKKVAGNQKKAEAAAQKAAAEDQKKAAVEDEDWGKGAKSNAKK